MHTEVEFEYIPRSFYDDPRVRVMIFRERGNATLEFSYSAIVDICRPASDGRADMLQALRRYVPDLLRILNEKIAAMPPGGVAFITREMLLRRDIAAA